MMKRFVSIVLIVAMLLSMASAVCFGASADVTTQIAQSLYWHKNTFYSENSNGDINENYLVYTPNSAITPYLAHGKDVAGAASMNKVFNMEKEDGVTLVAGVNADYYYTNNGIPLGMEMKDGIIKTSSHSSFVEIGFFENGQAIFGRSGLTVKLTNLTRGTEINYLNLNKAISSSSGPVLFNSDFEETNRASIDTINVAISIESGKPVPNGVIKGRVIRTPYSLNEKAELREGEMLLSVPAESNFDVQTKMNEYQIGDQIEVSFEMDPAWNDVKQAFGGKEILVENGNPVSVSDGTKAPRTAIGTKPDGTVIVYTCDGREYGGSVGLTLTELGKRMAQLGCTNAINLDGGVSTQIHVTEPGCSELTQVNVNAGTSLRSTANYICFKNNTEPTGIPVQLYAYPSEITAVSGYDEEICIKARDENWHPMDIPANKMTYTLSNEDLGSVENGVFKAGTKKMDGTMKATIGPLSIDLVIHVLTEGVKIEDFEHYSDANFDLTYVHNGKRSLKMQEGDYFNIAKSFNEKSPTMVSMWALGDISGLYLDYQTTSGSETFYFEDVSSQSWTRQIAELSENTTAITGIGYYGNGTVYIDQIMAGFGTYIDDEAPEISANCSDTQSLNIIKDYIDDKLESDDIQIRLDGAVLDFQYDAQTGVAQADLPELGDQLHHIIVEAADESGNKSRASLAIQSETEEETEYIFADMDWKNWATPYAEYLYNHEVVSGSSKNGKLYYNPTKNMTRQEFAKVFVSWYTSELAEFDDVELDFADESNIADWAMPYVKAAVSLGFMNGKNKNGKVYFDPTGSITRQEVMAVIGRILDKGYQESDLSEFSDKASVASWALPYVKVLVGQKIITGSNGKLNPASPVTREQVAKIIFEIY